MYTCRRYAIKKALSKIIICLGFDLYLNYPGFRLLLNRLS